MTSPPSSIASPLRLATFNVGRGLNRKLSSILHRCVDLTLDIVALQEIGDPVIAHSSLTTHTLWVAPGPSNHEAGVGLLVSRDLASQYRTHKISSSGRLVAVVLELVRGRRLMVVSAYMPTGIDHASVATKDIARSLYTELLDWTIGMHHVIILGDLNETFTRFDRLPLAPIAPAPRSSPSLGPIHILPHSGFVDEYRRHHPDAETSPGYTHIITTPSVSTRSRIDYIWTRNIDNAASHSIRIDRHLNCSSHHRLLYIEILLSQHDIDTAPHVRLQLPNMRAATKRQHQTFVNRVDRTVGRRMRSMLADTQSDDVNALDSVASSITTLARDCAFIALPITGAAPRRNNASMMHQRRLRAVIRLLRMTERIIARGDDPTRCTVWSQLHHQCVHSHNIMWNINLYYHHDVDGWIDETQHIIRTVRRDVERERVRMRQQHKHTFDANPAAEVHRMLQSNSPSTELLSVVRNDDTLTTSAAELEDVMVDHFTVVFAIPPADPTPLPYDVPAMLTLKPGIRSEWYDGLMTDVTEDELLRTISDSPLVSAPGEDRVSVGVWKIALIGSDNLRALVCSLFSSCIRTSTFPMCWKSSVIVPLVKDAMKDRSMSNIRPISLQSCLGKIFNKLLAHRLADIIARHPILNPAQRGFVIGGTTIKCIDELLDAWDWSRSGKRQLHTLFYDIKQAYDSVQSMVMLRALHRIGVPASFVDLVADSLTGLTSCVRTVYGPTRSFAVDRSVRQGDPLAPLLFVILMDGLHDGLDMHPLTRTRHGCNIALKGESIYLPSLGYADDTTLFTNTLADMRIQNDWVHYFMQFNSMRLNPLKCELVGRNDSDGAVTATDVAAAGILVHNAPLAVRAHDHPIRYLGVHSSFNGDWSAQRAKSRSMILIFTSLVSKFKMTVARAVHMFNTFLAPKLELAMHYVHGPGTSKWVDACDRIVVGAIKHAVSSPVSLSHSAVASLLRLVLPSWLECSVKVSELFLRMNSTDARWGALGRMLLRGQRLSTIDTSSVTSRESHNESRMMRTARLAVNKLEWSMTMKTSRRHGSRHQRLQDVDAIDYLPPGDVDHPPLIVVVCFPLLARLSSLVHNLWTGWGTLILPHRVDMYTDGSYDRDSSLSSWAVVIADQWFDDNYASVPIDEHDIKQHHVNGAMMIGSSINCTDGIYPAELQAIARALAMVPASFDIHIHTDSQSSIDAIGSYDSCLNERQRLRMSSRPLLALIHRQLEIRHGAGGTVTLSHVSAHSKGADRHSVGNRIADYQANRARAHPDRSYPLSLIELPINECEQYMHVTTVHNKTMINDPRRSAMSILRSAAMDRWTDHYADTQGRLAGVSVVESSRVVMQHGSFTQQSTFVHIATNTIHHHWYADDTARPRRKPALIQLQCDATCKTDLTVVHLAVCRRHAAYRDNLRDAIIDLFDRHECTHDWLRRNHHLTLHRMMMSLLPPVTPIPAGAVDALHLRHTRSMVGAWTNSESDAAAKRIGFDPIRDGRDVMIALTLLCVDRIHTYYQTLKQAVTL